MKFNIKTYELDNIASNLNVTDNTITINIYIYIYVSMIIQI